MLSDVPGIGQDLWDQLIFSIGAQVDLPIQAQLISQPAALTESQASAAGLFSSLNGMNAFEKVLQVFRANFTEAATAALARSPSDRSAVEYATGTVLSPTGSALGLIAAALSAPVSRGIVTIAGPDASTPPVFDMAWLSDPADADAQVAVAAFKRIRQAWSSISNITLGSEPMPGPLLQTDDDVLSSIGNVSIRSIMLGLPARWQAE